MLRFRALSRSALVAAPLLVAGACASSSHGVSFAPTTCVADAVRVDGKPVETPTPGALVRFTRSGLLEIRGRGGSQVRQTVHYRATGSGYEPLGFKGDFGSYDNFVDYDSAMDDLLDYRTVSVVRRHRTVIFTAGHTVVRCAAS